MPEGASSWLFLPGLVALLLGVPACVIGFFAGRYGGMPHCRRCDYLLRGLQSGRCPECGSELTQNAIIHGERIFPPWVHHTGLVLALVGLFLISPQLIENMSRRDWSPYLPARWLVRDLADASKQPRAWTELKRRHKAGTLSELAAAELTAFALKEQAAANPSPIVQGLLDYLADRFAAGELTPEQTNAFFEQVSDLLLEVRKTIATGDEAPFCITNSGRKPPGSDWWVIHTIERLTLNEMELDGFAGHYLGGFGIRSVLQSLRPKAHGPNRLAITVHTAVGRGEQSEDEPLWEGRRTLQAIFNVVPPGQAGIQWIESEQMDSALKACIDRVQARRVNGMYHVSIEFATAPVDAAFSIFARVDGREYALADFVVYKGGMRRGISMRCSLDGVDTTKMDLILRSNEKAVRSSIDLYESWRGEIVLKDVEIAPGRRITPP